MPVAAAGVEMPIGAPKVAYRIPPTTKEEWVQAHTKLYPERVTFLGQEIDDLVINQIISLILFMDAENEKDPIYLYINSPGGSVIAGLALYDTMQHINSPIITCNIGMAASMVRRRPRRARTSRAPARPRPPRMRLLCWIVHGSLKCT